MDRRLSCWDSSGCDIESSKEFLAVEALFPAREGGEIEAYLEAARCRFGGRREAPEFADKGLEALLCPYLAQVAYV